MHAVDCCLENMLMPPSLLYDYETCMYIEAFCESWPPSLHGQLLFQVDSKTTKLPLHETNYSVSQELPYTFAAALQTRIHVSDV
jgi:hypothetical protein